MRPPFDRPDCHAAWRGGKRGPPSFTIHFGGGLARSGVHYLLRGSKLPRAELLHMGATEDMLRPLASSLQRADVELLLGRIVLDAMYGHSGAAWSDSYADVRHACVFGRAVIEEYFS